MRPQPIRPSCSNMRQWLRRVDRVGAQHLVERAQGYAARPARAATCGCDGMAVEVDVEVVLPLAGPRRAGLEARHGHAVGLERHQQVVHRAGPVGHRHHQAGAVAARCRRRAQRLGQADDGEPGAVVGVVLDGVGHDVQAELGGRAFAGQRRQAGLVRGQARAFGVAGNGAAFGVRQMLGQPALALRQRLRMRQHHLDAVERISCAAGCGASAG